LDRSDPLRRGHALADQWQELAGVPPASLCRPAQGAARGPGVAGDHRAIWRG